MRILLHLYHARQPYPLPPLLDLSLFAMKSNEIMMAVIFLIPLTDPHPFVIMQENQFKFIAEDPVKRNLLLQRGI
jgi:hypothetical protein